MSMCRRQANVLFPAIALLLILSACGASGSSEGASSTTTVSNGATTTTDSDGEPDTTTSTTTGDATTTTRPDQTDPERQPYIDAFATGFSKDDTAQFDDDQLDCLGNGFLDAIGFDKLQSAGVTPEEFGNGDDFGGKITIDEATANAVYDQYQACDFDLIAYLKDFAATFTESGTLSSEQEACIDKALTEVNLRSSLVADLMGESLEDDPLEAVDKCVDFSAGTSSATAGDSGGN